jgi:hypothetical protein
MDHMQPRGALADRNFPDPRGLELAITRTTEAGEINLAKHPEGHAVEIGETARNQSPAFRGAVAGEEALIIRIEEHGLKLVVCGRRGRWRWLRRICGSEERQEENNREAERKTKRLHNFSQSKAIVTFGHSDDTLDQCQKRRPIKSRAVRRPL